MLNPSRYGAKTTRIIGGTRSLPEPDDFVYCAAIGLVPGLYHTSYACIASFLWAKNTEIERWVFAELMEVSPSARPCTCALYW